jgi:hypothetical protein
MQRTLSVIGLLGALVITSNAMAGEIFGGVYAHDIDDQISNGHFEKGPQIVVGARTTALEELKAIGSPRVHLLAAANTRGGTNYMAAGLSWRFRFAERFYIQPGIGLAVHDSRINLPSPNAPGLTEAEREKRANDIRTKLDLGSRVLFEPELSVGWRATPRLALELSWIHLSHGQTMGKQNPGLGDFGVRAIYRYGLDRGRGPER